MFPAPIQKLIEVFSKLPTVGPRTAARFVFYLLKRPEHEIQELLAAIAELRQATRLCTFCFNPFSAGADDATLCPICRGTTGARDTTQLCIVEKEVDLAQLEQTKKYTGLYFILGGTISGLQKDEAEGVRIPELRERLTKPEKFGIQSDGFKEIILATNPNTEGDATALYVERMLPKKLRVTRLGRGLPTGGELEYADTETLERAVEGRR